MSLSFPLRYGYVTICDILIFARSVMDSRFARSTVSFFTIGCCDEVLFWAKQ
jgi:hypothetical protein